MLVFATNVVGDQMWLEFSDVQFFKSKEIKTEMKVFLEISGLAFHSSLAVDGIDTNLQDNVMIVLVHLTSNSYGLRGDFSYNIEIPEKVDSIVFGPSKRVIWKRSTGVITD